MRIALNARCLSVENTSQLERFTTVLFQALATNYPQHEFFLLFSRKGIKPIKLQKNTHVLVQKPSGNHPLLLHWWYQKGLPKALQKIKADVFLSTDGLTTFKSSVTRITMVGAGVAANHFSAGNIITQKYLQYYYQKTIRESERLLIFSEKERHSLLNNMNLNPWQVNVIPPAANLLFKVMPFSQQVQVREKFVSDEAYYLLPEIPTEENSLVLILTAFCLVKKRTANDLKLVMVGSKPRYSLNKKVKELLKEFSASIIFTGPITTTALAGLYGAAVATLYYPVTHAINLPILEAQQSGCPVIAVAAGEQKTGKSTSLLTVPLNNAEALFLAMVQVYHDLELRTKLIQKGKEQAADFNQEKTAREVMRVLEETVKNIKNAATPV